MLTFFLLFSKDTFKYSSTYWTTNSLLNSESGGEDLLSGEAKLAAYSALNFTSICVGMNINGLIRWINIPYSATSLLSVISGDIYKSTNAGKEAWKSLVPSPSLQDYCNKEGFNIQEGRLKVRLGFVANNENDCVLPDSWVAFGTENTNPLCSGNSISGSCGNANGCENLYTHANGIILVK